MKKLLALVLCLSLFAGSAAFAEEANIMTKDVLEGNTTVSLTIDPEENAFVVVIPASVTIDAETQEGFLDIVLQSGWKLPSSNGLRVRLKDFANGPHSNTAGSNSSTVDTSFRLQNSEGATVYYCIYHKNADGTYTGLSNAFGSPTMAPNYWKGRDLINVERADSNTEDVTTTLKLTVPTLPVDPGEYTDTITFAVTLY